MTGAGLPPPVACVVEPRDLAAVRARQFRNARAKGGMSNVAALLTGVACGVVLLGLSAAATRWFAVPVGELFYFALVCFGVGVFVWTGLNRWLMAQALSRMDQRVAASPVCGDVVARLDEAGLEITSAAGVGTSCAYAAISAVERDADGLFIYLGSDLILHVPARAFPDEATSMRWAEAIEERRGSAGGAEPTESGRPAPPAKAP